MEPSHQTRRVVPIDPGLLNLIRAKKEWCWKPSAKELKLGFRGWHQRGYLPHFDAPGVTQFVTLQLEDSFPVTRNEEFESILRNEDQLEKRKQIEQWLDRGYGKCWLRHKPIAESVAAALRAGDGRDYQLQAWVLMPNHVHVVVEVWEVPLARLVRDWKGRSARRANELLKLRGTFWQADYFDSVVRDEAHLKRAIRYAEQNPVKAAMARSARDWLWSSASLRDDYERLPPPSERGL